jgi:hypothetical protein
VTCSGRAMRGRVPADDERASAQLVPATQEREPSRGQPDGHTAALAGAQPERAGAEVNCERMPRFPRASAVPPRGAQA